MSALSSAPKLALAADYRLAVRAGAVAGPLAVLVALLVLAHLVTQVIKFTTGYDFLYGLVPLFDLDREKNLPAFVSTVNLLLTALVLAVIAGSQRQARAAYARHWLGLAVLFVYLAADEAAGFHEAFVRPTSELLGTRLQSLSLVAWVLPALALVLGVVLAFLGFWWHLPRTMRLQVLASALVFISGAVGIEVLGGLWAEQHGRENLAYSLLVAVEEGLEMTGVLVFLHALLRYLETHCGQVRLQFAERP